MLTKVRCVKKYTMHLLSGFLLHMARLPSAEFHVNTIIFSTFLFESNK